MLERSCLSLKPVNAVSRNLAFVLIRPPLLLTLPVPFQIPFPPSSTPSLFSPPCLSGLPPQWRKVGGAPGRGRPVRQCSGEAPAARHGTGASKWSVSNTNMCKPVGLKATKHYFRHRFFSISNTSKGTVFGGGPGCPPGARTLVKEQCSPAGFFHAKQQARARGGRQRLPDQVAQKIVRVKH